MHRDIKLKNLMVQFPTKTIDLIEMTPEEKSSFLKTIDLESTDFTIKLNNFELSKQLPSQDATCSQFCGSLLFMSPQLLLKKKYTYKSDIWQIGVLLFTIINKGVPPF